MTYLGSLRKSVVKTGKENRSSHKVTLLSAAGINEHASADQAGMVDTVNAASCLRRPGITRIAAGEHLHTDISKSTL